MAKTIKKAAKKAVRKKVVYAETDSDLIQTVQQLNTEKIETGYFFIADINGCKNVKGRIVKQAEDDFYLCQNSVDGDNSVSTNLGYRYNWAVSNLNTPDDNCIENLRIYKNKPEGWKVPEAPLVITVDGDHRTVEFYKGFIEVGCTSINNTIVREIVSKLKD